MDRQTLFYRTLPAEVRSPIIKACVRFTEVQLIKSLIYQNVDQECCVKTLVKCLYTATIGQLFNPYCWYNPTPNRMKNKKQEEKEKLGSYRIGKYTLSTSI